MTDERVVRWTDAAGRPRRLRFYERFLGGYDRIEEEWTGDRWRTVGHEVVAEVRVQALAGTGDKQHSSQRTEERHSPSDFSES